MECRPVCGPGTGCGLGDIRPGIGGDGVRLGGVVSALDTGSLGSNGVLGGRNKCSPGLIAVLNVVWGVCGRKRSCGSDGVDTGESGLNTGLLLA